MAYGPQLVSLTQAGGDLDLLEALRGGRSRAKTQQEMLREQSMSPVEIGSYNGIQGKFPISQGINKIAQGLLATYMDSQARDKAQEAANEKTAFDKKGVDALVTALSGRPADAPLPEDMQGPVRPAEAPLTGDPRQMALITAMAGNSPSAARVAEFVSKQDAADRDRQDKLDSRAEIARQHNETMQSNAGVVAESRKTATDANTQRANETRDANTQRTMDATYNKNQPIFAKADAGFNTALANLDTTTGLIADIIKHPKLGDVVAPKNSLIYYMPTVTAEAEELQQKIKQLKATGSLSVLQELKKSGASLGAVTNADAERLDKAFSSLSLTTNPDIFKKELARIQTEVNNMRGRIAEQQGHAQNYTQSLYERTQDPTAKLYVIPPSTPEAPPAPTPRPARAPGDDPQPPVASAPLPPNEIAKLREGYLTTFGNGQVWTLKRGKPELVK